MPDPIKNPIEENRRTVEQDRAEQIEGRRQGKPSLFTCPECSGTLWKVEEAELLMFRCHVGHVLAGEKLFQEQAEAAENMLWYAIRSLSDRMVLGRQLAEYARKHGEISDAEKLNALAQNAEQKAEALRQVAENQVSSTP